MKLRIFVGVKSQIAATIALLTSLTVLGCSLPVPEAEQLSLFVPQEELAAVGLAEEGMGYFNANRFVDAELKFRQALYLFPDKENLKTNLAAALERTGQFKEALDIYRQLLIAHPASFVYKSGQARIYLADQQWVEAFRAFGESYELAVVQLNPNSAANFAKTLSVIAFRVGWEDEAVCNSLLVQAARPTESELERSVRLQIGAGRYGVAINTLDQYAPSLGLELAPLMVHLRSLALIGLNRLKEASEIVPLISATGAALDPADVFEMQLVRFFLSGKELDPDNLTEEQESFLEKLIQLVQSGSASMLYYPPVLEAKAFEQAQKLEGEI